MKLPIAAATHTAIGFKPNKPAPNPFVNALAERPTPRKIDSTNPISLDLPIFFVRPFISVEATSFSAPSTAICCLFVEFLLRIYFVFLQITN